MSRANFTPTLLLAGLLLATPLAQALPEDSQQPIRIQANSATLDERRNTAVYTGNVVITQGSMTLTGNRVTLHTDSNGELDRLVSEGGPATYQQTPRANQAPVKARADRIEYQAASERILLNGQAWLEQQGNTFSGQSIRYDIRQQLVNAGRDTGTGASSGSSERIEITIQPRRRSDTATDDSSNPTDTQEQP